MPAAELELPAEAPPAPATEFLIPAAEVAAPALPLPPPPGVPPGSLLAQPNRVIKKRGPTVPNFACID